MQKNEVSNKRLFFEINFLVLLCVEIWIALYVRDDFIRPYVGDVLVVILLYCMIRIVFPEKMKSLPWYIFAFASFVEALQYMHMIERLGLQQYKVLRVLAGSVFDWKDIICYGIGCFILLAFEAYRQ